MRFIENITCLQVSELMDGGRRLLAVFDNAEEQARMEASSFRRGFERAREVLEEEDIDSLVRGFEVDTHALLESLKQTLMNLMAVALYHLFEQQRARALSLLAEASLPTPQFQDLDHFQKLDELRLVCNAIKHGDGPSVSRLKHLRPDLFTDSRANPLEASHPSALSVRPGASLIGPLWVRPEDLEQYQWALIAIWEAAGRCLRASGGGAA